jgi:hypothetical protein
MFLGAAADLGTDLSPLQEIFAAAGIAVGIRVEKRSDAGLSGARLLLELPEGQGLRDPRAVRDCVARLEVSEQVRERSLQAIERLAAAEAEVHGIAAEEVHFHEIGALDTLTDIVGAFWCLERLGVEEVTCSHLPWFEGYVTCEHGTLPLPAPATLKLLQGKPVYSTSFDRELITPTGALLVDQIVSGFCGGPPGTVQRTGLGLGSQDLGDMPNGLRMILYEQASPVEHVWVLESNVDHLTGEEIGGLFDVLFGAGALDVLYLPGIMKKNRPGGLLQVVCSESRLTEVQAAMFRHSLTLGLRRRLMERVALPRRPSTLQTQWGQVEAKEVEIYGERYSRPEFESLKRLAERTGRSVVQLRYLLGGDDPGDRGDPEGE